MKRIRKMVRLGCGTFRRCGSGSCRKQVAARAAMFYGACRSEAEVARAEHCAARVRPAARMRELLLGADTST